MRLITDPDTLRQLLKEASPRGSHRARIRKFAGNGNHQTKRKGWVEGVCSLHHRFVTLDLHINYKCNTCGMTLNTGGWTKKL